MRAKRKSDKMENEVIKAELLTHLGRFLGLKQSEITIEIEFVDEVPLDKTGKIRKVISEIATFERAR